MQSVSLGKTHNPLKLFSRWLQGIYFSLVDRRIPPRHSHILNQRRLYIFPTRRGWVFFLLNIVLWFLGTNYQNNLVLALTFLLAALFVVTILHTYANLSGLKIAYVSSSHAFSGENILFRFTLSKKKRFSDNLAMGFQASSLTVHGINVECGEDTLVEVPLESQGRGWLAPGRLLVKSEYPLGLLRCWTWLNWDVQALVYPQALEVPEPESRFQNTQGNEDKPIRGGEDYSGLREYSAGDPIKHIAWKSFARGQGLYSKEFTQSVSREIWLDFQSIRAGDTEEKLSGLCYWALEYEKTQENYGLRLGDIVVPPGKGDDHKFKVLSALACFDLN